MKNTSFIAIGIVFGIVISIIILGVTYNTNNPDLQSTTEKDGNGLPINIVSPDFKLSSDKGYISKDTFKGKPLFIFFTTTWCTPCQTGAQQLARYFDEVNAAFNVLIVFVDPEEEDIKLAEWKEKYGRDSWYIAKDYYKISKDYNIKYLDSKYVLDKEGKIVHFDTKPLDYNTAKKILGPLLK